MDGPRDYHTKQSKSEKKGQIPYNVTYMWILKYKSTYLLKRKKQTYRHREQTYSCQGSGEESREGMGVWD